MVKRVTHNLATSPKQIPDEGERERRCYRKYPCWSVSEAVQLLRENKGLSTAERQQEVKLSSC